MHQDSLVLATFSYVDLDTFLLSAITISTLFQYDSQD